MTEDLHAVVPATHMPEADEPSGAVARPSLVALLVGQSRAALGLSATVTDQGVLEALKALCALPKRG